MNDRLGPAANSLEARLDWWRRYAIAVTGLALTILLLWLSFVTRSTANNAQALAVVEAVYDEHAKATALQISTLAEGLHDVASAQRDTAEAVATLTGVLQAHVALQDSPRP